MEKINLEKRGNIIEIPKNVFEKIAEDVRHELLKVPKVSDNRDDFYGLCGTAAELTAKKICEYLKENFGPESIENVYQNLKIYYLQIFNRNHHITTWGKDFNNSWKIDPTIDQFKELTVLAENKFIFSPTEQYPFPAEKRDEVSGDIFTNIVPEVYFNNK